MQLDFVAARRQHARVKQLSCLGAVAPSTFRLLWGDFCQATAFTCILYNQTTAGIQFSCVNL